MFDAIPHRSLRAKFAMSVLLEEVNDIDIYVEDTGKGYDKLYTELFSRALSRQYRVGRVIPVGDRQAVMALHGANIATVKRPTLYVVDGDLYLLTAPKERSQRGLFVLPCYCVENILVHEEAIAEVLFEEDPTKDRPTVRSTFDFCGWLNRNGALLTLLFINYAAAFKLCPSVQTVGCHVRELVGSDKGELSEVKVHRRIELIRQEVSSAAGKEHYAETIERITKRANRVKIPALRFVSGKDYLLPLLLIRARSTVATHATNLNLTFRLSRRCGVTWLKAANKFVATREEV